MLKAIVLTLFTMVGNVIDHGLVPEQEVHCLAETIYHEARSEKLDGRLAVAQVVMNRVAISEFPNKVCDVVYQRNQFEWVSKVAKHHKHYEIDAWERSKAEAMFVALLHSADVPAILGSRRRLTFFSVDGFNNPKLSYAYEIGNHRFYRLEEW